jgi:hypothetical protein
MTREAVSVSALLPLLVNVTAAAPKGVNVPVPVH